MKYSRYVRRSHFIFNYFNTIGTAVYGFENNFLVVTPYIHGITLISMRYKTNIGKNINMKKASRM